MRIRIHDLENVFKDYEKQKSLWSPSSPLIKNLKNFHEKLVKQGLFQEQEVSPDQEFEIIQLVLSHPLKRLSATLGAVNSNLYENKPIGFRNAIHHLNQAGMLTRENYALVNDETQSSENSSSRVRGKSSRYCDVVNVLGAAGVLNQRNLDAVVLYSAHDVLGLDSIFYYLKQSNIMVSQEIFDELNSVGKPARIASALDELVKDVEGNAIRHELIRENYFDIIKSDKPAALSMLLENLSSLQLVSILDELKQIEQPEERRAVISHSDPCQALSMLKYLKKIKMDTKACISVIRGCNNLKKLHEAIMIILAQNDRFLTKRVVIALSKHNNPSGVARALGVLDGALIGVWLTQKDQEGRCLDICAQQYPEEFAAGLLYLNMANCINKENVKTLKGSQNIHELVEGMRILLLRRALNKENIECILLSVNPESMALKLTPIPGFKENAEHVVESADGSSSAQRDQAMNKQQVSATPQALFSSPSSLQSGEARPATRHVRFQ